MKAVKYAAHLVETLGQLLVAGGRISYAELEFIADWVDTNFGALIYAFVLDRYAELVSAGQVA